MTTISLDNKNIYTAANENSPYAYFVLSRYLIKFGMRKAYYL
jgi:hypothetical protein